MSFDINIRPWELELRRNMDVVPGNPDLDSAQRSLQLSVAITQLKLVQRAMLANPDDVTTANNGGSKNKKSSGTIDIGEGMVIRYNHLVPALNSCSFDVANRKTHKRENHVVSVGTNRIQSITTVTWSGGENIHTNWPHDLLLERNGREADLFARKANAAYRFVEKEFFSSIQ